MPPVAISVPLASAATPVVYQLQGTGEIDIKSIVATFNGAGAGSDFYPVLSIYSSDDRLLSRTRLTTVIAAGGSGVVTFAPFLRDALDVPAVAGARVYNAASITIADATSTAVTFDTERYDTGSFHSVLSNTSRLVAQTGGQYVIGGSARFDVTAGAVGKRQLAVRINGTLYIAVQDAGAIAGDSPYLSVATAWKMAATDYAELAVYQNSGAPLAVRGQTVEGDSSLEFWIEKQ